MPTTTSRGFPKPLANRSDTPDVPRDIGALADFCDGQVTSAPSRVALPAFGQFGRLCYTPERAIFLDTGTAWQQIAGPILISTSLPGSPYEGQEIYYQTAQMATDKVPPWHLRYNSAAGTYKWETIGQPAPYVVSIPDSTNVSGSGWTVPGGVIGPRILSMPAKGEFEVEVAAFVTNTNPAAVNFGIGFEVNGTTPPVVTPPQNAMTPTAVASTSYVPYSARMPLTLSLDNSSVQTLYKSDGSHTYQVSNRFLRVWPVRVG